MAEPDATLVEEQQYSVVSTMAEDKKYFDALALECIQSQALGPVGADFFPDCYKYK